MGVGSGVGLNVVVAVGVEAGVGLRRVLATGEGDGSSEHPARSMATSTTLAPSQLVMDFDIVPSLLLAVTSRNYTLPPEEDWRGNISRYCLN